MSLKFSGTGVAIVTPFNADKSIDYTGLEKLINHIIDGGCDFIVSLGTTGESANLSQVEKDEVVAFTKEKIDNRIPLVVGIGGNNTAAVVAQIEQTNFDGIAGILSVSPYYNKPNQEGIYQHYKAIADVCPVDIILYNVPGRTSSNMTPETTLRLANDCNNIVAVKEASGDFIQAMEIIKNKPEDFAVLSGDDALTFPFMTSGMDGVISVVANAYPEAFSTMIEAASQSNNTLASEWHYRLLDMMNALFMDGNPAGIKEALKTMKICDHHVRLPLVPVNDNVKAIIIEKAKELQYSETE